MARNHKKIIRRSRRLRIDRDVLASIRDPGFPIDCYSILEFCKSHRISERYFRQLRAAGLGPDELRLGSTKVLITKEAAARWRAAREAASKPDAAQQAGATAA